MSYTVYKMVIRGHIPELNNKTDNDVIDIFRKKLGEPDDVDQYDVEVESFSYDPDKHVFCSVYSYKEKKWGLEYVITESESGLNGKMCLSGIQEIQRQMQHLFPSIQDVAVFAYDWYNGVDEPIRFEAPAWKGLSWEKSLM